jgi:hypothetical protein
VRKLTLMALVALMVAPAAEAAPQPTKVDRMNAGQSCKALRESMGIQTFRMTYGTNANRHNAMGRCVRQWAHTERDNRIAAREACKAEREADPAAFENKYGNFGKCVRQHRRAESQEDRKRTMNAAQTCMAERETLGNQPFATKYGGGRNAFGKCVSTLAKAQNDA